MTTRMTVNEYVARRVDISEKTQKEIAIEAGFPHPNFLSMIRHGNSKIPVAAAPRLAKALGVSPKHLTRLVMQEYNPEIWEALESTFGLNVTDNEAALINFIRDKTCNTDPVFDESFLNGFDELLYQESMV